MKTFFRFLFCSHLILGLLFVAHPVGAASEPLNIEVDDETPIDESTATEVEQSVGAAFDYEVSTMAQGEDYPITNLGIYNIFSDLPKIGQPIKILHSPFMNFTYGPYMPEKEVYKAPYPDAEELTQRIITLKKTIEQYESQLKEQKKETGKDQQVDDGIPASEGEASQSKDATQIAVSEPVKNKPDAKMTQMNIHLADLYALKFYKTRVEKYIQEAVEIYKTYYTDLPLSFGETTSLNTIRALVEVKDFATAFPMIKKIIKAPSAKYISLINETMLEYYYMSSRYRKAENVISIKIDKKELLEESPDFLVRTGDIYFLLNRFQDAAEWYQTVLKPKEKATASENLSWLYLAESLHQLGSFEVSRNLYRAMKPFFADTIFEQVIDFRLAASVDEKELIMKTSHNQTIVGWMRVEVLTDKFIQNPKMFTAENFNDILEGFSLNDQLRDQVILLQGYGYRNNNEFYKAIDNFHRLEMVSPNRYIRAGLEKLIVSTLFKKGLSTKDSEDALNFVRSMLNLKYNLRTQSPDEIYKLLQHNLSLIGLENASAELTLRIVDLSMHRKKDKNMLQLKLAKDMHDGFAYRQSIKVLEQMDTKLLDPLAKEEYNAMLIDNLMETDEFSTALDQLTAWANESTTPEQAYWISLNRTKILYQLKKYDQALDVIINTIGDDATTMLPEKYKNFLMPLKAYKVMVYNKLGRNNECLFSFKANREDVLSTPQKNDVILSALSSAMAMNRNADIKELLNVAETALDETTYNWLDKWTKGKMWINQINRYLDNSSLAINKGEEQ